jgi:glycosyltransferase involved in cell wall biosynthesis
MEFSVVIPTRNRREKLAGVLEAIAQQENAPDFELIVVDDGSTDGTADWLASRRFPRQCRIVTQPHRGPAAARNAGLALSSGRWIGFLGDDTVPSSNWLATHHAAHCRRGCDPHLAVIGYTRWHDRVKTTSFLDYINECGPQFGYSLIVNPEKIPFYFFYGSNMSLCRDFLLRHPFSEAFPDAAWEDIECGYRLQQNGMRLVYNPEATVSHDHDTGITRFFLRQEKVGYSSVIFHQLAPELDRFLGLGPGGPPPPRLSLSALMLEMLARGLERMPLSLPSLWEKILRDRYVRGQHRGWSDLSAGRLPAAIADKVGEGA